MRVGWVAVLLLAAGCAAPVDAPEHHSASCEATAGATVRVSDPSGPPPPGLEVSMTGYPDGSPFDTRRATAATDGSGCASFAYPGVPGEYRFAAAPEGCLAAQTSLRWEGAPMQLRLDRACAPATGECAHLAAADLATLLVRVTDFHFLERANVPVAGAQVSVGPGGETGASASDGCVAFHPAAAGDQGLHVSIGACSWGMTTPWDGTRHMAVPASPPVDTGCQPPLPSDEQPMACTDPAAKAVVQLRDPLGKPMAGIAVVVTDQGTKSSDPHRTRTATTDAAGCVTVAHEHAGLYGIRPEGDACRDAWASILWEHLEDVSIERICEG